jgi:hypothetical protein
MYQVEDVRRSAREAVNEKGTNYVYPEYTGACEYVKESAPSCLVGHILFKLGFPLDILSHMDDRPDATISSGYHPEVREAFTDDAIRFMATLQSNQDEGRTWGTALERAEELATNEL